MRGSALQAAVCFERPRDSYKNHGHFRTFGRKFVLTFGLLSVSDFFDGAPCGTSSCIRFCVKRKDIHYYRGSVCVSTPDRFSGCTWRAKSGFAAANGLPTERSASGSSRSAVPFGPSTGGVGRCHGVPCLGRNSGASRGEVAMESAREVVAGFKLRRDDGFGRARTVPGFGRKRSE